MPVNERCRRYSRQRGQQCQCPRQRPGTCDDGPARDPGRSQTSADSPPGDGRRSRQ
jgi:hypothetical protein